MTVADHWTRLGLTGAKCLVCQQDLPLAPAKVWSTVKGFIHAACKKEARK
jgi:hypothetical protein